LEERKATTGANDEGEKKQLAVPNSLEGREEKKTGRRDGVRKKGLKSTFFSASQWGREKSRGVRTIRLDNGVPKSIRQGEKVHRPGADISTVPGRVETTGGGEKSKGLSARSAMKRAEPQLGGKTGALSC